MDATVKRVGELIDEMIGTDKNELIRDCINYQRQLFGFGCEQYRIAVTNPAEVFDKLHEMDVDTLQAFNMGLSALCSSKAMQLMAKYK